MKRVSVRFTDAEHQILESKSQAWEHSINDLVRKSVRDTLDESNKTSRLGLVRSCQSDLIDLMSNNEDSSLLVAYATILEKLNQMV